jgi:hypothetical protein
MKTASSLRWRITSAMLLVSAAFLSSSLVAAANLDGKAARELLSDRMMQSKNVAGEGFYYWSWKSDGTVCMHLLEKTGACADTGRWKVERDRVCYEFTWWGKESGFGSACFRISDLGKGRYEALQDNGLTLFEFMIAK